MTRETDVKKAIGHLVRRRKDLVYVRGHFLLIPIKHITRAVWIRTSWLSREAFYVHWGLDLTFRPNAYWGWPYGEEVSRGAGWDVSAPGIAERVWDLMEAEALPPLHRIETLDDLDRFVKERRSADTESTLLLAAARGDFDYCDQYLDARLARPSDFKERKERERTLAPLISARDRGGIARLLHEWEAFRIKALKLEKYWQPSPFPVESEG
jgi:hypothetical protein